MIETNDLNNNLEIKSLNLLIEEYLEKREDTLERYTPQSSRRHIAVRYSVRRHHPNVKQGSKYQSSNLVDEFVFINLPS